MSQNQITTNASPAKQGQHTPAMTRRMKEDAMRVFASRKINDTIAYKLVGWMENEMEREVAGRGNYSVGRAFAEFVNYNMEAIRALPLRD